MEVIKNKKLVSMLSNFPNIINKFLGDLPKEDYPVLDTFKFVSCWLSFVMDRGFCKLERIKDLIQDKERYFVMRIKNDMSLQMQENGKFLVGTGAKKVECRIVNYCDLEERTEFRLATNLPEIGEFAVSNEEIGEFYRNRWQIELLWKFLKMHLKLDRLITKNINGIEIQIYCCLIGYVILQLVEIPKEFGDKALDKLRYLQAFMCENISYVHWFRKIAF
jgi:putative transposase